MRAARRYAGRETDVQYAGDRWQKVKWIVTAAYIETKQRNGTEDPGLQLAEGSSKETPGTHCGRSCFFHDNPAYWTRSDRKVIKAGMSLWGSQTLSENQPHMQGTVVVGWGCVVKVVVGVPYELVSVRWYHPANQNIVDHPASFIKKLTYAIKLEKVISLI